MNSSDISPVVKQISVRKPAAAAFDVFTRAIADWWPLETHSRSAGQGGRPLGVSIEPKVGGRVFETCADGSQLDWGQVLRFEPGSLFEMTWQMGRPVEQSSTVTVTFLDAGPDTCTVTLTHHGWERLGGEGPMFRANYDGGWHTVFTNLFAAACLGGEA
jgi:uncharacterized protein YndB with AHSA1/START domain